MQMLIDGEWVDAENGNTIEVANPASGTVIDTVPEASDADVDRDVLAEQRRVNAEIDVIRHAVRGVVGDDEDATELRRAGEAEGFVGHGCARPSTSSG